jgi:hypothetical protein
VENPCRSVVFLRSQEVNLGTEDFKSIFVRKVGRALDTFLLRPEERVIVVDEAQGSYADDCWRVIVKLGSRGMQYVGLRLVVFSSFGSSVATASPRGEGLAFLKKTRLASMHHLLVRVCACSCMR